MLAVAATRTDEGAAYCSSQLRCAFVEKLQCWGFAEGSEIAFRLPWSHRARVIVVGTVAASVAS